MAIHCYINPPLSLSLTNSLQWVQNCAELVVTCTDKREHTAPVLFQLHWLCIRFRLLHKILFHTFKVLTGRAALYISNIIKNHIPIRLLQSENCSLFIVPKKATKQCTERNLSGQLWNKFPNHFKWAASKQIFCNVLKVCLFKLAYL